MIQEAMKQPSNPATDVFRQNMRWALGSFGSAGFILAISLYWEPLRPACWVTAIIFAPLVAWLHGFWSPRRHKGLQMAGTTLTYMSMFTISHHFHDSWAILFQYLGVFILAFGASVLIIKYWKSKESQPPVSNDQTAHES